MKLGLSLGYSGAKLRIPLELVQLAERLGYDSVWTAEAYGSDAITPLAWIAAHTDRIRLGTGIMQLAGRAPAMAAMQAQTVDALAGGNRVIAGLGCLGPRSSKAGTANHGASRIGGCVTTSRLCARSTCARIR